MTEKELISEIQRWAKGLRGPLDLDPLIDAIGDSQIVLLGEASHGTSEFYSSRAELSKRLIREKGFRFIAVEGDWPSCYQLNRWVKREPGAASGVTAEELLRTAFQRWPSWMWANREVAGLMDWLRDWNQGKSALEMVGFYGLDVYSLWESIDEILSYLQTKEDSEVLRAAEQAFGCFQGYQRDEQRFAYSSAYLDASCQDEVIGILRMLHEQRLAQEQGAGGAAAALQSDEAFHAEINALVTVNAEHYYRTMIGGDAESWNIRDRHMVQVLDNLMEHHGGTAKAIVWEHNTHVGDARATDMEADGMVNVGQLIREKEHVSSYTVGFSTYKGTVLAGRSWGDQVQTMELPEAWKNSWDELLHRSGGGDKLMLFGKGVSGLFEMTLGQRAVGVVYRPQSEWGNYVPTSLSNRYDALIYLEETHALEPLHEREPATV